MIARALAKRALLRLRNTSQNRGFPLQIGLLCAAATSTATVPVEWIVLAATLLIRERWVAIALFASLGSALASLALYLAFHHFGWALLLSYYPDIAATKAWNEVTVWLGSYGAVALFVLMALPIPVPKLPALAFAGIYRLPVMEVLIAILAGKLIKYSAYAFAAAYFPRRLAFVADIDRR